MTLSPSSVSAAEEGWFVMWSVTGPREVNLSVPSCSSLLLELVEDFQAYRVDSSGSRQSVLQAFL